MEQLHPEVAAAAEEQVEPWGGGADHEVEPGLGAVEVRGEAKALPGVEPEERRSLGNRTEGRCRSSVRIDDAASKALKI